ncbi:MAG TPA: neutral/alkaline non-lysosomal ceramidase N-terminal domain-containing protein [Chloroflexota bacterium]|nr:neutral/alkaline non-lysosomal ceramidase N-terminal domain-containing protein [Chloroflexota bacterium]
MGTTTVTTPTSRVRFGIARVDITPPVGIYHRMWGAARHHQATGVHRPQVGDVMVFAPLERGGSGMVRAHLDLVGLSHDWHDDLVKALSETNGIASHDVVVTYSHTHSGGFFQPDRVPLPGGDLIPGYIQQLTARVAEAGRSAAASLQPAVISYATGRCNLAANRDYWDDTTSGHVCGFNPDAVADDTVMVARMTDASGRLLATLVNYACHPTTLAWDNTLLSPDYIGAMREIVEQGLNAPCVFAQGACGDLGPCHGFVGDTAVADQNGRQLGYAALSALTSLGPPLTDCRYRGPVISGATIGVWENAPPDASRSDETARFEGGTYTVDLALTPKPDRAALEAELAEWEGRQREADSRGEVVAARDYGARAERARRWLGRLESLPSAETFPFPFSVYRVGDAIWVAAGAEPYNVLQIELRRRFPARTILVSPLAGGQGAGYLLPRNRYGKGLYQEEASSLAPGCLEMLIEAIAARVAEHA